MGRKPMTLVISLAVRARANRCTRCIVSASVRDRLAAAGEVLRAEGDLTSCFITDTFHDGARAN